MQPVRDLPFETLRLDPVMLVRRIRGQALDKLRVRKASRNQSQFLSSATFQAQLLRLSSDPDWMLEAKLILFCLAQPNARQLMVSISQAEAGGEEAYIPDNV